MREFKRATNNEQRTTINYQLSIMSSNLLAIKQRFGIIGNSKLLDNALDTAVRVATTDLTVLIQGESGVGKEAFSKIIHSLSARKHNPFIAINCGAIPEGTINSELFGHDKGAFTGAVADRKGYFETVNGGTIFLDEIGEMPLDTQAMLLRILESGEYLRVGSSKVEKTNVRVIAATNVDLANAVQNNKFREDLYYRLSTVPIRVPSLKERQEDIYPLFKKFCYDFADRYKSQSIQLDDRSQILIERYVWPGNIRELKNMAEQLSALSEERLISAEVLLDRFPQLMKRDLPAKTSQTDNNRFEEREIMYKLLFDMKNDLNYLKTLVAELIKTNNLAVPTNINMSPLSLPAPSNHSNNSNGRYFNNNYYSTENNSEEESAEAEDILIGNGTPLIIKSANEKGRNGFEVVDESLNMTDNEKRLIVLALKKHNNRRRDAAEDLGISERTLYRKIKEYDLE